MDKLNIYPCKIVNLLKSLRQMLNYEQVMNMNHCPNCGASVGNDDLFCGSCGTKLIKPSIPKTYGQPPSYATQPSNAVQVKPVERIQPVPMQEPTSHGKDPGIALALSIIPGLGVLYTGRVMAAFMYFFLVLFFLQDRTAFATFIAILIWIKSAQSAYSHAKKTLKATPATYNNQIIY